MDITRKFIRQPAGLALASLVALAGTAHAQFTWNGTSTLNADQTYDGAGIDSALNPRTFGSDTNNAGYIGLAGTGSLTVSSGSLTWNSGNPTVGRNANGNGTLNVNGGTLNVFNGGTWGSAIGHNSGTGVVNVAAGATLNWTFSGSSETGFAIANQGGTGTVNVSGAFNLTYDTAQSPNADVHGLYIGGWNVNGAGNGTLNLFSGTFTYAAGTGVGAYIGTNGRSNHAPTGTINIQNGAYIQTGSDIFAFGGGADHVNFVEGGTGYLSIAGWTESAFLGLATAGNLQIGGVDVGDLSGFSYRFEDGQGILALAIPEPSAFAALAGAGVLGLVALRRRRRA